MYAFCGCDCADTMADVNVNAPAQQAPAMAPPTRTDDQILPRKQMWCLEDVGRIHPIPSIVIKQKKNLALHTQGKKKANPLVIPSVRFTKLIIHHLQSKHKFHPRPDSPLHLPYEEYVLGYLKFSEQYYNEYLEKVAKHQRYLAGEEVSDPDSPAPKPAKATKPKATKQSKPQPPKPTPATTEPSKKDQSKKRKLVKESSEAPSPAKRPKAGKADTQRAIEESLKEVHDAHQGQLPPVVGSNLVDAAVSHLNPAVVHAGPNREHMDVEENLKLLTEDQVRLKEPARSAGTLSSLLNLDKELSFADQFLVKKSQEDKLEKTNTESSLANESRSHYHRTPLLFPLTTTLRIGDLEQHMADLVQDNLALEERLDKHGSRLYKLKNLDIPHQLRDLPEADIKDILHPPLKETKIYKAHEDHKKLYKALEKSMDRDHSEQLLTDLAEARRKKKRRHESPKTPPGSPPSSATPS
ncbi:hypothetical protein Tco_0235789 [Tanacetum coccineum]